MEKQNKSSGLILLKKIVEGTSSSTGLPFFQALVKNLSEVLGVFGVWVTEYLKETHQLNALAFYLDGKFVDEYLYKVEGTPCEPVLENKHICHFPTNVIHLFPKDPDLPSLGAVSYMGIALRDIDNSVLGHLAILDNKPMPELPESYALVEIFASRATAEMRRLKADNTLLENQQKMERLINGSREYIIEFNHNLQITQFNHSAASAFTLENPAQNKKIYELFAPQCQPIIKKAIAELLSSNFNNNLILKQNLSVLIPSGQIFPVEATLSKYEYKKEQYCAIFIRSLKEKIENREEIKKLNLEKFLLEEKLKNNDFDEIIGKSEAIQHTLEMVAQVAPSETTVLITGETGTGKELLARAIHKASNRKNKPMVSLNCAALPKELIESELFGHVKGAFTGAATNREGRFSLADQGTIFLDEIGEMPLELQTKLLRVLQEGEFEPLGSSKTRKVDIRLIAATNRELTCEIAEGRFREDLYYRLNVFPIHLPSLRERGEDIILLAEAFLAKFSRQKGKVMRQLSELCKQSLLAYHWPGNIRELQNIIERSVILSKDGKPDLSAVLPAKNSEVIELNAEKSRILTEEEMRSMEKNNIIKALEKTNWKIYGEDGAAQLLGIPHTTLSSRIKKLGISRKPILK